MASIVPCLWVAGRGGVSYTKILLWPVEFSPVMEENKMTCDNGSLTPVCFETALRTDLKKFIKKLNHMENGCNLHSMIVNIVERSLLEITLEETGGNQTEAARVLGLNRNTLRRKIDDLKIKPARNGKGRK
ncbi:MAG: hypothetical protein HY751_13035 [Nitrospinae bacterium]|nr:hypothetical protein [Nitrospinota bacterium]